MELFNPDKFDTTPRYDDFVDVYPSTVIAKDRQAIEDYKRKNHIDEGNAAKRGTFRGVENYELASQLENDVLHLITGDDLFSEFAFSENQPDIIDGDDYENLHAQHSAEYDDYFNHADIVCVIKNSLTGGKPIPFIIDTTYNTDNDKVQEKMGWLHPQLQHPGLGTIKYYADKSSFTPADEILPRGRISALPRFVVGFNPDLLDSNTPEHISKKKLCLLRELNAQSTAMLKYFEKKYPDGIPPNLASAQHDIAALDAYFRRAQSAFDDHLRQDSKHLSETPMSSFYGQPEDAYYQKIHHYPYDSAEPVVRSIELTLLSTYN